MLQALPFLDWLEVSVVGFFLFVVITMYKVTKDGKRCLLGCCVVFLFLFRQHRDGGATLVKMGRRWNKDDLTY